MNKFRNVRTRKKKISFFFTVIVLLVVIFVSNSNSNFGNISENTLGTVTNTVSKFFYGTISRSLEVFRNIFGTKEIRSENERLRLENVKLKEDVNSMQNVIAKEKFLQEEYNLGLLKKESLLRAYVTARDAKGIFIRFNIDKGSKDGVNVGDIIVQGTSDEENNTYIEAVVGKVVEVGYNWSKVSSLVDNTTNISFKVIRTQFYGVISGQENNLLTGSMYKVDADIVVGDKLMTSGIGGVFPNDLYIGEVTEIRESENKLEKAISVKSPVDFTKLYRVFVLKAVK